MPFLLDLRVDHKLKSLKRRRPHPSFSKNRRWPRMARICIAEPLRSSNEALLWTSSPLPHQLKQQKNCDVTANYHPPLNLLTLNSVGYLELLIGAVFSCLFDVPVQLPEGRCRPRNAIDIRTQESANLLPRRTYNSSVFLAHSRSSLPMRRYCVQHI